MLKILIADNHPVAKEGLRHILNESYERSLIHNVESGNELLRKVSDYEYDIAFLELHILGYRAFSTIEKLRKEREELPLLVLSSLPEELFAIRALRSGASGYINKSSSSEELRLAISRVLSGKKYVSNMLAEKIANNLSGKSEVPLQDKLSNREFEVMQMIASGEEIKVIAEMLGLSPRTVSIYRGRILKKMNLKNNGALSVYAVKHGLIKKMKNL